MAPVKFVTLAGVIVFGACSTAAQRRAAETAEIEKEAAQEVRRICGLPESAREAEIKKLEDESVMTVTYGKD
jgi:hypothetical protein